MISHRWTHHRVCDAFGNDSTDQAPIWTWWIVGAAAEETLQGGLMSSAWLKLLGTHLSEIEPYWLQWSGDMAESAELRRAYSALYGRFFARALLTQHLGISRFLSMTREGLDLGPPLPIVSRNGKGDIPDWLAWDERNRQFALCEAKGSLTANDFLKPGLPKCVRDGKSQFDRVDVFLPPNRPIQPAQWVAATRWATDLRKGEPATILWDPPIDGESLDEPEATKFREAMTRAWLRSIAPRMGWDDDEELLNPDRGREALVVRAKPGPIPGDDGWPLDEEEPGYLDPAYRAAGTLTEDVGVGDRRLEDSARKLRTLEIYSDPRPLSPPRREATAHEGAYVAALITRMGIRPVRTDEDRDALHRAQDAARGRKEPAVLVGLQLGLNPAVPVAGAAWHDRAGIAAQGRLGVFDLRQIEFGRYGT